MERKGHSALIALLSDQAAAPVAPEIAQLAGDLRATYGDSTCAILAYGSSLRDTDIDETLVDLYVLVDDYRAAHKSVLAAWANRLLPPNVYYLETTANGRQIRAKYAVVSLDDFEKRVSPAMTNPYFWARFIQPCALVFARDDRTAGRVHAALATASSTAYRNALGLDASGRSDWRQLWISLFQATYRTELRPEGAERAASIVDNGKAYFEEATRLLGQDPQATPIRANWFWRRLAGKAITVCRLIKAGFTFRGGADYLAWKISRHSGVTVEITPWQRRHPILGALMMAPKLYRKGGFR